MLFVDIYYFVVACARGKSVNLHSKFINDFMILNHLSITNYRNLQIANLDFSPNVNCLVGANGMGKSNVLDAIYYLSFCRGFASAQDSANIHHASDYFILEGDYQLESGTVQHVCCSLKQGSPKRVKVDGKAVKRISDHVGRIPMVMIAPADAALILGGSEERRRFMDMVIMQYCPSYLDALIRYEKALKQRNALLKQEDEPDESVMLVVEEMLSMSGQVIYQERKQSVAESVPIILELYHRLSGDESKQVDIQYVSHGDRVDLLPQLTNWRIKERIVGYSLHGMHKDDLDLKLNGYAVKREASQGQQKTFFIAMKLSQYVFLKNKGEQRVPLLLLDDIFDKLDAQRVRRIIDYVSSQAFGQIFITDTRREHLDGILAATQRDYKLFSVVNGEVNEV